MGTIKISNLSEAVDAGGVDFCGVQSGATKKVPVALLDSRLSEYMVPIVGEQSGDLRSEGSTIGWEWSMGNGAVGTSAQNGPNAKIYVPTGYECHVVAVGLAVGVAMTAEVQVGLNGVAQATANVTLTAQTDNMNTLSTPLAVSNGDKLGFYTASATGTGTAPHVATAWLRFRRT